MFFLEKRENSLTFSKMSHFTKVISRTNSQVCRKETPQLSPKSFNFKMLLRLHFIFTKKENKQATSQTQYLKNETIITPFLNPIN